MKHCSGPRLASGSVLQNVFQRMSAVRGSILVMGLLLVGQTAFAEAAAPGGPLDGKIQRDNQHTERRLAQTEVATPTVSGTITIIYEKPKDVPPPRPLLSVSVTPSPPTFSVGDQTITYNYVIKNTGQGSAATLVLRDSRATGVVSEPNVQSSDLHTSRADYCLQFRGNQHRKCTGGFVSDYW
jgi:hypothetical protein